MKPTRVTQIENALRKPMTCKQLADAVFLSWRAAEENVKRMHELGQVHIVRWERTGGRMSRVYKIGKGKDAPMPPAFTRNERMRRTRAKESPDDKEIRLARERAKRKKIKVHPLMAAFYSIAK